jgi:hypothetical protein
VIRNAKNTKIEATTPDMMLTAIGVPKLVNRPIHLGPAPSSEAIAWVRSRVHLALGRRRAVADVA